LRVAVNESLSLDPAVDDLIENEPAIERVPFAPAYLPVPLSTEATPFTVTLVGALSPAAQACWLEEETTLMWITEPPPRMVPIPEKGSHVLDGLLDPVPLSVLEPSRELVPVALSDVTVTELELHSNAMLPE
jgi:hypothetical protein